MIELEQVIRQLAANAETIRALVQGVPDEQAQWKPDPESWSVNEVMDHIYNEERIDFRKHLKEMLSDPPQPWARFRHEEYISVKDCRQAVERFLSEREASLAWLKTLRSPDWDIKSQTPFGPSGEGFALSAGDVLVSWVDHDLAHLRQMIRLLHAWHEKQSSPYSVEYGGGRW
ncbi:MAG: DinB family protein [Anaerolineae bacterium]|nr:DinB family protein [Anaerolineae bacterium]